MTRAQQEGKVTGSKSDQGDCAGSLGSKEAKPAMSLATFFHKESPLVPGNVFSSCEFSFSEGLFLTLCGGFLS